MAATAYKFNERRRIYGGSGNSLFDAAVQTRQRRYIQRNDRDTRDVIGDWGWSQLVSASRYLTANFGPIRDAIFQMANYAVGCGYSIQYRGPDADWGKAMEEAVTQHDKICDLGARRTFRELLTLDLISLVRDGDANFLLTETENGFPLYQSIPAHRICGSGMNGMVEEGIFKGRSIQNGIILDDYGRTIGYRLVGKEPERGVYVAAGSFGQYFRPEFTDQARGIPWLASAINDIADIFDVRQFTKTGLKGAASVMMIEHNEAGAPLESNPISGGPAAQADYSTPTMERLDEGTIRYFRAGTDSKMEFLKDERPSDQSQKFSFEVLRGAFAALGWPIEFYDPSALGGANIRLRVAQAMRTIEGLQELANRIAYHKHRYTVAKLMKLEVIEWNDTWWQFGHQTPRSITVDNGRDTKADLQALESGAMTFDEWFGQYGQDARAEVRKAIQFRKWFDDECKAEGVDPDRIIPPPNRGGAPGQQEQAAGKEDEKK